MNSGHHLWRETTRDKMSAVARHTHVRAEQRLRGSRTQTYEDAGLYDLQLFLEPRQACRDFAGVRLFVHAAPVHRDPLEVFDDVGDVGIVAVDPRCRERFIEHSTRRPDEWGTLLVFHIAGLLADEHDPRARLTLSEDGLRCGAVQRATVTILRCLP